MRVMIWIILICLFGGHSCKLEDSYKEFFFENVSDIQDENYFASKKLEFAKVGNVVFIPRIKEIDYGEYIIYISAYSESGTEQIQVDRVILKEEAVVLMEHELDKNILLEKKSDSIYEGRIDGGTFTETEIEIIDGKEYDFIIQVEVIKEGKIILDNISFEVIVKGYQSFVTPT